MTEENVQQKFKVPSRYMGKTGLLVSELSFGTWVTAGSQVEYDVIKECIIAAYDAGIYYFDTAEIYADGEAEVVLGNVLKETGWKRSELVISTKFFKNGNGPNTTGLSRKHVIEGMNASLARLQLDYVDIVFAHRPDHATPMEEIVRAFSYLIDKGLAFYWGTSEWTAQEIQEAYTVARQYNLIPPSVEQPQYNMFAREKVEVEFDNLYKNDIGLGLTTWSPLKYGVLTGKYNNGIPEGSRLSLEKFAETRDGLLTEKGQSELNKVRELSLIAQELGCSMSQLALAWCLCNQNVSTVILGASRPSQVTENVFASVISRQMTSDHVERIEAILGNKTQPKRYFERFPH